MPIKKIFICNYNKYTIYKVVCGIDVYYEAYDGNEFVVMEYTITNIKTELKWIMLRNGVLTFDELRKIL